jgi:hypothetical protein
MKRALAMIAVSIAVAPAHADPTTPEATSPSPAPTARKWRILAAGMLGMRGNQGGLIDSGYRIGVLAGVIWGPVDIFLASDHQIGDDNRIPGTTADPAVFTEWTASLRVGRRFSIGTNLWVQTSGGLARISTRVTRLATMNDSRAATLAFDAMAAVVWSSGLIASTLIFGATIVPTDQQLVVDGVTFVAPQRVEPWFGLGVAMIF